MRRALQPTDSLVLYFFIPHAAFSDSTETSPATVAPLHKNQICLNQHLLLLLILSINKFKPAGTPRVGWRT
jgi:hypothetical protein